MKTVDETSRRYAVRRGIARISLAVLLGAIALLILQVGHALQSPEFAGDLGSGTHDYQPSPLMGFVVPAVPIATIIGAVFGRGNCRSACVVILVFSGVITMRILLPQN